jgi:hypothetical protein
MNLTVLFVLPYLSSKSGLGELPHSDSIRTKPIERNWFMARQQSLPTFGKVGDSQKRMKIRTFTWEHEAKRPK